MGPDGLRQVCDNRGPAEIGQRRHGHEETTQFVVATMAALLKMPAGPRRRQSGWRISSSHGAAEARHQGLRHLVGHPHQRVGIPTERANAVTRRVSLRAPTVGVPLTIVEMNHLTLQGKRDVEARQLDRPMLLSPTVQRQVRATG